MCLVMHYVTLMIALPTGTKIFNWSNSYLVNASLALTSTTSPKIIGLLYLLASIVRIDSCLLYHSSMVKQ